MYTSWLHLMITGLSLLHNITSRMRYKLHIDLGDGEGGCPYAEYSTFAVEGPETKYRLCPTTPGLQVLWKLMNKIS